MAKIPGEVPPPPPEGDQPGQNPEGSDVPGNETGRLHETSDGSRDNPAKQGEPKGASIELEPAGDEGDNIDLDKVPRELAPEERAVDKSGRLGPKSEPAFAGPSDKDDGRVGRKDRVYLEGERPGKQSYQAKVNESVREESLGYFSAFSKPLPDDGRGAEAAGTAYATRIRQKEAALEAESKEGAPSDSESQASPDTTERQPTQEAQEAEPQPEEEAQTLSEAPAVDQPKPESTAIPPKETADQKPISRTICDLSDTGVPARGILAFMKREHPDMYEHEGFQVVVGTSTDKRRGEIAESGALDEYIREGKARIKVIKDNDPLPEGTLLTLAPDPNAQEAIRVAKKSDGEVFAAMDAVYLRGDEAVEYVGDTKDGAANAADPAFFAIFNTTDTPVGEELAYKVANRMGASLHEGSLQETPLGRKEDTVAEALDGVPPVSPVNFQIGMREQIARLAEQSELVHVAGYMASKTERPPMSKLAIRQGLLLDTVTEVDALEKGASDAGAAINLPPQDPGEYNYALIDGSKDQAARGEVATEYINVVTAAGNEAADLLGTAMKQLEAEAKATQPSDVSAATMIDRSYQALLRRSPRAELDHDLAYGLANLLEEHGHHDLALTYTDRAIQAAPQLAASAHTLKAGILRDQAIVAAEQIVEAEQELAETDRRSPTAILQEQPEFANAKQELMAARLIARSDYKVWDGIADVARAEGNNQDLLEALLERQRYAPQEGLTETVDMWEEMIQTTVRLSGEVGPDEPGEIRILEHSRYDDETLRDVTEYSDPIDVPASVLLLEQAAAMRTAALETVKRLSDTMSGEKQDAALERIRNSFDATAWDELPPEQYMVLNLEEAQRAREIHDTRRREDTSTERRVAVLEHVVENTDDVGIRGALLIGHYITPSGSQTDYGSGSRAIIDLRKNNRHTLVTGIPGAGKTNTELALGTGLVADGIPTIMIDAGKRPQYLSWPAMLEKHGIKVNYLPLNDMAVSLGLLDPDKDYDPQRYLDDWVGLWAMLTDAREPFINFVEEGGQKIFADLGFAVADEEGRVNPYAFENPRGPSLKAYTDAISNAAKTAGYSTVAGDVIAFTGRRTGMVKRPPIHRIIDRSNQLLSMNQMLREATLIDATGISNESRRAFGVAALALSINQELDLRRREFGNKDLPLNGAVILGEAKTVLRYRPGASAEANMAQTERGEYFARMIAQWRGLGEAVIAGNQESETIIEEAAKDSAIFIAHRANDPKDRRNTVDLMQGTDDDFTLLSNLEPGQALMRTPEMDAPRLVRIVEVPREEVHLNAMRNVQDPPLRGRQPKQVRSRLEQEAAETDALRSESAGLQIWITTMALSHMGRTPLPDALPGIQEFWDKTTPRHREAVLETIVDMVVDEREFAYRGRVDTVKARLKDLAISHLEGVSIAGKLPGTSLTVPEIIWAQAYERNTTPYLARAPSRTDGPAPKVVALPGTPIPHDTVENQIAALEEHEYAALPDHPEGQRAARNGILGENKGKMLYGAIANYFRGGERDRRKQVRILEEQMGLVRPGEPKTGPLSRLLALINRVIDEETDEAA